jgi:hypothetical protein
MYGALHSRPLYTFLAQCLGIVSVSFHITHIVLFWEHDRWWHYIGCARKSHSFWNLKICLPAMQYFHTDSHCAQCCLEFSWHENVSICINKFFHFALKRYFISKTVRCFWHTLYKKKGEENTYDNLNYTFFQVVHIWWIGIIRIFIWASVPKHHAMNAHSKCGGKTWIGDHSTRFRQVVSFTLWLL